MLILYTSEDGKRQIRLRAERQPVWLSQLEDARTKYDNAGKNPILLGWGENP